MMFNNNNQSINALTRAIQGRRNYGLVINHILTSIQMSTYTQERRTTTLSSLFFYWWKRGEDCLGLILLGGVV